MAHETTPVLELSEALIYEGGEDFLKCYQCALCTATCPWGYVKEFNVRSIMHRAQLGLEMPSDQVWTCSTCAACVSVCPRNVDIIGVFRSIRSILSQSGVLPSTLRGAVGNVATRYNPWGGEIEKRTEWAKDAGVENFDKSKEFLYFPCCTLEYDPRSRKVAKALSKVFKKAEVKFGILGEKEVCCGDIVRVSGDKSLYSKLKEMNHKEFVGKGVNKVVVSSPHCYNVFKNEVPFSKDNLEVLHVTQYLLELIRSGRLKLEKEVNLKVTYHDPCYLGRHNGVYDDPREVIKSIPGVTFVEMEHNRERSICCGGGGGGMWMETKKGERISDLRLEEARKTSAQALVVACPFCLLMFEDSIKSSGTEDFEVLDVVELVRRALPDGGIQ